MIKVGLNGFGRIGRAITRILAEKRNFKIIAINEIDEDVENLAYLLKYDSIYGKFKGNVKIRNGNIIVNNNKINFFSKKKIQDVPWERYKVDVVIEATGVHNNLLGAKKIVKKKISKIVITHSSNKNIDFTMIMGVNEKKYDSKKHHIISSSVCDASALGPVLKAINDKWEIENGFITTLHSALAYQNLLDGSLKSISNPTHAWTDYSLGRNSLTSLIPKNTTSIKATTVCVPELKDKISGISFRVPTSIVCGSDLSLKLKRKTKTSEVKSFFKDLSKKNSKIFDYQTEKLVSIDHLKTTKSAVVDSNYIDILNKNFLKMVIWYDNEWGYGNRVIDIVNYILKK